jgi:hypothetical protein
LVSRRTSLAEGGLAVKQQRSVAGFAMSVLCLSMLACGDAPGPEDAPPANAAGALAASSDSSSVVPEAAVPERAVTDAGADNPATALIDGPDGASASSGDSAHGSSSAAISGANASGAAVGRTSRVPRPDSVRALYVNGWAAGSRSRMANLIRIANETEINAFIIDIKESDTYLSYKGTNIALAKEIGADQRPTSVWLPALIDTLDAYGIYSIARIVVFKDRMLAEKKPELAIRHENGNVWKDKKGGPWVNPYDRRVWDYNIAIAREALDLGFGELQWDYVRFPDVTNSARAVMRYPGSDGVSRAANIRAFIEYSKQQLASYNVPVAADVFGLVTHAEGDVEIGQNWEQVTVAADVLLPMVYPSHYYKGLYGLSRPIANPYQVVRLATADAIARNTFLADSAGVAVAEVMPWLEAMSIRGASYGAAELRAQIQGAYDSGAKSWALWNPGSKFGPFEGALRSASGELSAVELSGWQAPEYDLPRHRLSPLVRRRARALAVADSVAAVVNDSIGAAPAAAGTPQVPPPAQDSTEQH